MTLLQLATNISVIVGLWIAIYGIDAWRREHTGRRQIELAEETLALFYEASDLIRYLRHPASYAQEHEGIERNPSEPDEHYDARRKASVVFNRYNENKETFNKIRALRYRFMAQIGKEQAIPFDQLHNIVNEILSSARILARLWSTTHFTTDAQWETHFKQVKNYEKIFWDTFQVDDPVNSRLDQLVQDLERTCSSVISGSGGVYAILNKKIGRNG